MRLKEIMFTWMASGNISWKEDVFMKTDRIFFFFSHASYFLGLELGEFEMFWSFCLRIDFSSSRGMSASASLERWEGSSARFMVSKMDCSIFGELGNRKDFLLCHKCMDQLVCLRADKG